MKVTRGEIPSRFDDIKETLVTLGRILVVVGPAAQCDIQHLGIGRGVMADSNYRALAGLSPGVDFARVAGYRCPRGIGRARVLTARSRDQLMTHRII